MDYIIAHRLVPRQELESDEEFISCDDFYKRINDLADTVQHEMNDRSSNTSEDTSDDIIMAAKITRGLGKMKRLDNRLAELSRVRTLHLS